MFLNFILASTAKPTAPTWTQLDVADPANPTQTRVIVTVTGISINCRLRVIIIRNSDSVVMEDIRGAINSSVLTSTVFLPKNTVQYHMTITQVAPNGAESVPYAGNTNFSIV